MLFRSFDFYLMHSQGRSNYEQYQRCRAYETAFELKKEGRIRHVGPSGFTGNGGPGFPMRKPEAGKRLFPGLSGPSNCHSIRPVFWKNFPPLFPPES